MSESKLQASRGDVVERVSGGSVMMKLIVSEVTDDLIVCGPWTFRRDTGGEVDEDLGWDGVTVTGSFLRKERP